MDKKDFEYDHCGWPMMMAVQVSLEWELEWP